MAPASKDRPPPTVISTLPANTMAVIMKALILSDSQNIALA